MTSKSVRNAIATIIVLIIGVELIWYVTKKYVAEAPASGVEILSSMESFVNLFIMGLVLIILLLVPIYLSKRSEENKIMRETVQ